MALLLLALIEDAKLCVHWGILLLLSMVNDNNVIEHLFMAHIVISGLGDHDSLVRRTGRLKARGDRRGAGLKAAYAGCIFRNGCFVVRGLLLVVVVKGRET